MLKDILEEILTGGVPEVPEPGGPAPVRADPVAAGGTISPDEYPPDNPVRWVPAHANPEDQTAVLTDPQTVPRHAAGSMRGEADPNGGDY